MAVEKIIVGHTAWAEIFRQTGSSNRAVEQEAEVERLKHFLDKLPDFAPPVPKGPLWPDPKSGKLPTAWHHEAELLLSLYRAAVAPGAGVSRMGPAVRFIRLALKRCGLGSRNEAAIELALTHRD